MPPPPPMPMGPRGRPWGGGGGFVLTRLHLRYGKDGLGEDLVFRQAPAIVGGREFLSDGKKLETGAVQSSINNFQARYAIRHAWKGAVKCANPRRGIWGGPPAGEANKGIEAAQKLAFVSRGGINLVAMVARDESETKIDSGPLVPAPAMYQAAPGTPGTTGTTESSSSSSSSSGSATGSTESGPPSAPANAGGCAGCRVGETQNEMVPWGAAITAALGAILMRLRRGKKDSRRGD